MFFVTGHVVMWIGEHIAILVEVSAECAATDGNVSALWGGDGFVLAVFMAIGTAGKGDAEG